MTSRFDRSSTSPDGDAPSTDATASAPGDDAGAVLQRVHRAQWGRLLSLLVARTRRLELAEDALGEAFAQAAARWTTEGVPDNPAAWLYTAAYRRLVGSLRSEAVAARKVPLLAVSADWVAPTDGWEAALDDLPDERLQLILLCCHPALSPTSRSALALRLVLGTPTEEIARLFLVPRATMAARITRAKRKIAVAGIPLSVPAAEALRQRLDEVCRTIYLAFTAGYRPGSGPQPLRVDLSEHAVRLAALTQQLVPESPQLRAMLALLLLQHARRDARQRDGALVPLSAQDRTTWRHDEIAAALGLLDALSPTEGYAEELRLQALIAAEHARATAMAATDWGAIAEHYRALETLTGSAVVRLNRAVAVAEVHGPQAGLALLADLDASLADHHGLEAVRAELHRRAGNAALSRKAYRRAIAACDNDAERAHLQARLASLNAPEAC